MSKRTPNATLETPKKGRMQRERFLASFAECGNVLCAATVYKLCERGELAHVRISNAIRVAPEDLATFIERRHATIVRS